MALTENERRTLVRMIEAGEEIPIVRCAKDYTIFFGALKSGNIAEWKSNLMVDLSK